MNAHWCGKKLASVYLASDSKHPCPCGKKAMKSKCCKNKAKIDLAEAKHTTVKCEKKVVKSKCCKNKSITLKAKNDITKARHFELKSSTKNCTFTVANPSETLPFVNFEQTAAGFYHPPPIKKPAPIYLLDKVFRI